MKVLSIGTNDASIFEAGSALRRRTEAYAALMGELVLIDTTTRAEAFPPYHAEVFSIYATNSYARILFPFDAARLAARLGGDLVTAQDPFEHGLAGALAATRLRVPLHIQLHTDPFAPEYARASYLNRVRLLLMPFVLRRASGIRVVSTHLRDEIVRRYHPRAPVSVLPVYADLARFRSVARTPEKGLVLWVGRFEREKDPLCALEAFAAARARATRARLVMLGEGSLARALRARATALGIAAMVEFPGWQDPLPYLVRAELVLATSRYEGYGLSVVEALAAGVPVLATDAGIAREAGAIIAERGRYAAALSNLLVTGAPPAHLLLPPEPSFAAYIERYAEDLRAVLPLMERGKTP